jgi:Brp/Blh family beta-carotene 15,15'-monooxygenase
MSALLVRQGRLFIVLACALLLGVGLGFDFASERYLPFIGLLVVALGMPHGALDSVFAQRLFAIATLRGWAVFSLLYISLALGVAGLWWWAPTAFLVVFLAMSAVHFAADLGTGVHPATRVAYGGAIIVLPALLHAAELSRLLGWIAGAGSAATVVPVLQWAAVPWLVVALALAVYELRHSAASALEFAALVAVAALTPPLAAFAMYFCVMHSPRHLLRTLAPLAVAARQRAIALALWPTVATLVLLGLGAYVFRQVPVSPLVMQLVFVSLAALTLPHMLLLDRASRRGLQRKQTGLNAVLSPDPYAGLGSHQ